MIDVDRDDAPWKSETVPLVYSMAGSAPFAAQVDLEAGLHRYDISVALTSGSSRTVIASAVNVVCGDCYLLNGQSNTVAADYHGENLANQSQSPWIRSFGNAVVSSEVARDLHWNQADGESLNAHGSVGAWGLRMARNLLDAYQVPIALVNGAEGGTSITQHLRNDANPTDLDTIYGRMLHRTREAGVAGEARALLWYQGESDGEERDRYQVDFATLHGSWALDYPALEKIYVFQIRKGCGVTFAGVREVLRRLPDSYPEIAVMSTDAAPRHDGCHFFYAGYRELGDRIARLVARDFHGSTDTQNIDPPNVATAQFTSGAHTQIRLTFHDPDDTLVWAAGTETYLLLNDGTAVVSGAVAGNTILLQLAGPSAATLISLDGHAFDGPWITNSRQVGALSFFDVPILP